MEDVRAYRHKFNTPGGVADLKGDLQKRTTLADGIGKALAALSGHVPEGLNDGLASYISSTEKDFRDIASARPDLAPKLGKLLERIFLLEQVPKCITHHDFSTSNFLVDETSGKLTGIVDWGDAGLAPCGLDMSVLFHLLDKNCRPSDMSAEDEAVEKAFWTAFLSEAPGMQGHMRSLALCMQFNGVNTCAYEVMRGNADSLRWMNSILDCVPFPLRSNDMTGFDNAAVGLES